MGQGLGLLGGAAGGGQAIKDLIAQRLLAQQQAERERAARAGELFNQQQLGEQGALRRATLANTQQEQQSQQQLRRDQLAQALQLGREGQTAQTERTQAQINAQNERARQAALDRENLARITAGLRPPPSEPLVPVQGPEGLVTYMPRSQAAGQQRPVAAVERAQGISADRTLDYITQIGQKFKPEYVGPFESRYRSLKQNMPGMGEDPAFGDFQSSLAALRNELTRLLFSSRASDQDIQRVQEQIPTITDKPLTFSQKLRQTAENAKRLRQQLSTGGVP